MLQQSQHDRIVLAFHEAVLCPELWPAALGRLSQTFAASGATAQMIGGDGFTILTSPSYEGVVEEYLSGGWLELNKRMERGIALTKAGERGFITEYRMFTPEELARDPFQQEFAARYDMDREAGIILASHAGSSFVLTVPRAGRMGAYSADEIQSLNRLAESLAGVCSLALRLKLAHAEAMGRTLAGRGEAMALLTPNGSSLFHTQAFERLLGGCLMLRGGCIHAADPACNARLQALLAEAAQWPDGGSAGLQPVVVARPGGFPLILRCHPVVGVARDFLGLARTILVVDDLAARPAPPSAQLVRAAFGLTSAEARFAVRIADGETLRNAADAEKITYESARIRLKAVFAKTGTKRQTELAALLTRAGS